MGYSWPLDHFERNSNHLEAALPGMLASDRFRAGKAEEVVLANLTEFDGFHHIQRLFGMATSPGGGDLNIPPVLSSKGAVLVVSIAKPDIAQQRVRLQTALCKGGLRL